MLRILFAVLFTIITILFSQAGWDWLNLGHGLHPVLAFPIATLSFVGVIALFVLAYWREQ